MGWWAGVGGMPAELLSECAGEEEEEVVEDGRMEGWRKGWLSRKVCDGI